MEAAQNPEEVKRIGPHMMFSSGDNNGRKYFAIIHINFAADYNRYLQISKEEFEAAHNEESLWDIFGADMSANPQEHFHHKLYFTENPRDYAFI